MRRNRAVHILKFIAILAFLIYISNRYINFTPTSKPDVSHTPKLTHVTPGCIAAGLKIPGLTEALQAQASGTLVCRPPRNRNFTTCSWHFTDLKEHNFGDDLGPVIADRLTAMQFDTPSRYIHSLNEAGIHGPPGCLFASGSAVHLTAPGDYAWGCGTLDERQLRTFPNTGTRHIYSVRGPRSRHLFEINGVSPPPPIYGDSAQLLPCLCPEIVKPSIPEFDVCYVPHRRDVHDKLLGGFKIPDDVKNISKCNFVVATSMHGLIVAEAFGIPARVMMPTGSIVATKTRHKFYDYFDATERKFGEASSFQEALQIGGHEPVPPSFDYEGLANAFPYFLFE